MDSCSHFVVTAVPTQYTNVTDTRHRTTAHANATSINFMAVKFFRGGRNIRDTRGTVVRTHANSSAGFRKQTDDRLTSKQTNKQMDSANA